MDLILIVSITVLVVSALLQFWAAGISFSLIRDLEDRGNWFLIALGFTLMALRRLVSLSGVYLADFTETPNLFAEGIALLTSVLFVMGLLQVKPYLEKLQNNLEEVSLNNDQACRANEELKRFNSFLAHNIHVPCRQAEADVKCLSKDSMAKLNDDEKQHLQSLLQQCSKVRDLGDKLLLHVKAQNRSHSRESINLSGLIREIEENLQRNSVEIKIDIDEGIFVESEPHVLKEALNILLESMSKGHKGTINIARESAGNGQWNIVLKSEGLRIDRFEKLNLYSPFSGLRTYRDLDGHGLDLSVVSSIIHSLSGRIWADSSENGETVISISL